MITDLLKLMQAIQSAQSDEDRERAETALKRAVKVDVKLHFDDAPDRRIAFDELRGKLGIFDPPERQEELKEFLYSLGARPTNDQDETPIWHLPAPDPTEASDTDETEKTPWSQIYGLVLLVFLAVAAFVYLTTPGGGPPICDPATLTPEEFDSCIDTGGIEGSASSSD